MVQRFHRPRVVESPRFGFAIVPLAPMPGRGGARLYRLAGGVLATIAPSDEEVVHGMKGAVFVPCMTWLAFPPAKADCSPG